MCRVENSEEVSQAKIEEFIRTNSLLVGGRHKNHIQFNRIVPVSWIDVHGIKNTTEGINSSDSVVRKPYNRKKKCSTYLPKCKKLEQLLSYFRCAKSYPAPYRRKIHKYIEYCIHCMLSTPIIIETGLNNSWISK